MSGNFSSAITERCTVGPAVQIMKTVHGTTQMTAPQRAMALEKFPDTFNSGYFLIKLALWVMASAILGQALVDIFRPLKTDDK